MFLSNARYYSIGYPVKSALWVTMAKTQTVRWLLAKIFERWRTSGNLHLQIIKWTLMKKSTLIFNATPFSFRYPPYLNAMLVIVYRVYTPLAPLNTCRIRTSGLWSRKMMAFRKFLYSNCIVTDDVGIFSERQFLFLVSAFLLTPKIFMDKVGSGAREAFEDKSSPLHLSRY